VNIRLWALSSFGWPHASPGPSTTGTEDPPPSFLRLPNQLLVEQLGASDSSAPTAKTRLSVRCQEDGNEHVHLLARAKTLHGMALPQTSEQTPRAVPKPAPKPIRNQSTSRIKFRTFKDGLVSFLTCAEQAGDYGSDQLPPSENAIYEPAAQGCTQLAS